MHSQSEPQRGSTPKPRVAYSQPWACRKKRLNPEGQRRERFSVGQYATPPNFPLSPRYSGPGGGEGRGEGGRTASRQKGLRSHQTPILAGCPPPHPGPLPPGVPGERGAEKSFTALPEGVLQQAAGSITRSSGRTPSGFIFILTCPRVASTQPWVLESNPFGVNTGVRITKRIADSGH